MDLPIDNTMPPAAPPHLELLSPPDPRPFESELAATQARWRADVAKVNTEVTVFTDQYLLAMARSVARD